MFEQSVLAGCCWVRDAKLQIKPPVVLLNSPQNDRGGGSNGGR